VFAAQVPYKWNHGETCGPKDGVTTTLWKSLPTRRGCHLKRKVWQSNNFTYWTELLISHISAEDKLLVRKARSQRECTMHTQLDQALTIKLHYFEMLWTRWTTISSRGSGPRWLGLWTLDLPSRARGFHSQSGS